MRVFILEDCEIFRLSLQLVLGQEADIEVVGSVSSNNQDLCRQILNSKCDVLLMGLRLRGCSGLELADQLRMLAPQIPVLAIGFSTDAANMPEMKKAGINVFIPMSSSNEFIANQIRHSRDSLWQCDFSGVIGQSRISTRKLN